MDEKRKVGHRTVGPIISTASGSWRDGVYAVGVSKCTRQEAELIVTFQDRHLACVWIEVSESDESDPCISSRTYNKLTSLQLINMWLFILIFQLIMFTTVWPVHVRIYASFSPQSLPVGLTFKKKSNKMCQIKYLIGRWMLKTSINYSPIPRRNIALQINGPYWIYVFIFGPANYITGEYVLSACTRQLFSAIEWFYNTETCISCHVEVSRRENYSTILLNV